jgi:hypothetical protein
LVKKDHRHLERAKIVVLGKPKGGKSCGIGLLGGQRLSLADYVALTEAHGRDACRRRVPQVAYAPTVRYLNRRRVRAARRVVWVILFGEDRSYTIRFDGARWSRQRGAAPADVTVQTSPPEWVKFLSADPKGRRRWLRQQRAAGTRQRLDELMTSFGVLQQTLRSREPGSQRAAMAKN